MRGGAGQRAALAVVIGIMCSGCFVQSGALSTEDASLPRVVDAEPEASLVDAAADECDTDADCGAGEMCQEREGIRVCVCAPSPELCDGLDNDCNPATPDGAAEVTLGDACDGTDADLCALGSVECNEGSLGCVDEAAPLLELCDGLDNDCNPDTVDGADEPSLGAECDGDDVDMCLTGTWQCNEGALTCPEEGVGRIEICDGLDNDCDGEVNEGGVCSDCVTLEFGSSIYLYCDDPSEWSEARASCSSKGGGLLIVDNEVEWEWVRARHREVTGSANHESWIGVSRDPGDDSVWLRVDGARAAYFDWWTDGWTRQPDNWFGNEDCVEMFYREEMGGRWNDEECDENRRYWCEFDAP